MGYCKCFLKGNRDVIHGCLRANLLITLISLGIWLTLLCLISTHVIFYSSQYWNQDTQGRGYACSSELNLVAVVPQHQDQQDADHAPSYPRCSVSKGGSAPLGITQWPGTNGEKASWLRASIFRGLSRRLPLQAFGVSMSSGTAQWTNADKARNTRSAPVLMQVCFLLLKDPMLQYFCLLRQWFQVFHSHSHYFFEATSNWERLLFPHPP